MLGHGCDDALRFGGAEVKQHLASFFARLNPVLLEPDVGTAALAAGLMQWASNPPPEGTSERGGFTDLQTGDGIATTFFLPADQPPLSYPIDLPWITNAQTVIAEYSFAGNSARSVTWANAPGLRKAATRALADHVADGWLHVETGEAPVAPGDELEMMACLRRGDRVRIFMLASPPGPVMLTLMDWPAAEPAP
jgi:hypothetical protein